MTENLFMRQEEKLPTPTRGVPVELEGKTYYLRFSLAAMKSIVGDENEENFFKNMTIAKLGPMLLAGLKASAPELTLEQLEEMIDLQNIAEITDALGKAVGRPAKVKLSGEDSPAPEAAPEAGR
jgi:hypothetical protein